MTDDLRLAGLQDNGRNGRDSQELAKLGDAFADKILAPEAREPEKKGIHIFHDVRLRVDYNDAVFGRLEQTLEADFSNLAPLGYVLNGEEDCPLLGIAPRNAPRIQAHGAAANVRKFVFYFKVLKGLGFEQRRSEKLAEAQVVPLPISQIVEESTFRLFTRYEEGLIEGCRGALYS